VLQFGTVPSPTAAQSALINEVQSRYKAFVDTGNPNPSDSKFAQWSPATTSTIPALLLGGEGDAPVGACDPGFWGKAVQYDYQVFDI